MDKISEIIESSNLDALFFVFFNLSAENAGKFKIKIQYRKSINGNMELTDDVVRVNNRKLESKFGIPFSVTGKSTHTAEVINDTEMDREKILNYIYNRTQQLRFDYDDHIYDKKMLASFFVPRGSADLNRYYFAVDIIRVNTSQSYITNLISLLSSSYAIRQLNLNFRELQPDFTEGIAKRQTQLRINLKWFFNECIEEVEKINIYKSDLLKHNSKEIKNSSISYTLKDGFIERAIFYRENILGEKNRFKNLSDAGKKNEVQKLRKELDLNDKTDDDKINVSRNSDIVKLAIISQPDECVCCKNKYDLMDRTFMMAEKDRPYLEIHHVISFGADKNSDVLENLVKVCPACHRALTPGRADVEYQRALISNILDNSESAQKYVNRFLSDKVTKEEKIEYTLNRLR